MRRVLILYLVIITLMANTAYAGILPSSKTIYGEFMPSPEFAIGIEPITDITQDGIREQVYSPFSDSDYITFSRYLGACGCTVGETASDSGSVSIQIILGNNSIRLVYDRDSQTATVIYPSGTRPEKEKGDNGEQADILPSLREVFGTRMPHPAAVFGRKPDKTTQQEGDSEHVTYKSISEDEYVLFGRYASEFGCVLDSYEKKGSTVICKISRGADSVTLTYDNITCILTLDYPTAVYYDDTISKQIPSAISILPMPDELYGVYAPSLSDVLRRVPDKTRIVDNGMEEIYTAFTDEDYYAFSNYLNEQGCSVKEYSKENGVLTIKLISDGAIFVFAYDRDNKIATVTYPAGLRPYANVTPTPTPATKQTPTPTPTPATKQTPTPTPRVTAKPRYYSVSECYDIAIKYLKSILLNPNSLIENGYKYTDDGDGYLFTIDYSAQVRAGGYNRTNAYIKVDYTTGQIIYAF